MDDETCEIHCPLQGWSIVDASVKTQAQQDGAMEVGASHSSVEAG